MTGTEVADEDIYYEVEVTLDDGRRSTSSSTELRSGVDDGRPRGAETNDGSGQ